MLDVHPPHAPTHTWRDFFIHIATLCVGLLIAVGLEQAVEALHHRHQRHELEVQLHDEAQRNLDLTTSNLTLLTAQLNWYRATIAALNSAPVTANHISLSVIPSRDKSLNKGLADPSQTAWAVAKANGTVALLPEDEAQVYARLDRNAEQLLFAEDEYLKALAELISSTEITGGLSVFAKASVSLNTRDALVQTYGTLAARTIMTIIQESTEAASCRAVLNGARSVNEMLQYQHHESEQQDAQHPQK
jgi:hypothetical protein